MWDSDSEDEDSVELAPDNLEWMADLNATDHYGKTAIDVAAAQGNGALVSRLLERGANTEVRNGAGLSILMLGADGGHMGVVQAWLRWKDVEGINARDINGATALWLASHKGRLEVVRELLLVGASPLIPNRYGRDAIWAAARGSFKSVIRTLEVRRRPFPKILCMLEPR
jgi:ankyrin repeat protein